MLIIWLLLAVIGAWGWLQISFIPFTISLILSIAALGELIWCKTHIYSISQSEVNFLGCLIIISNIVNFAGVIAGLVITFCK